MCRPRLLPKSGPHNLQEAGAVSITTERRGVDRLQLTAQVLFLFTLMFFQMDSNHRNTIIRGHTRRSTSKTHLLQEARSTPQSASALQWAAGLGILQVERDEGHILIAEKAGLQHTSPTA